MERIYEWFKESIGYIITFLGGIIASAIFFLFRGGDSGLGSHKRELESAKESVGDSQQTADRASVRVDDIKDTAEKLGETHRDVGAILEKYNRRLQQPEEEEHNS